MDDPSEFSVEPTNLKLLRRLVTTLLAVMIIGFITLIFMFVMRFQSNNQTFKLNDITLPIGTSATAYTQGDDWYAIVDDANKILIFNKVDNTLRQTINIKAK
ncbi:DUF6476 family protein [Amylibacter sp.]|jgi:hypothetical protein|nr:DUF6476 family protein [Amylibacter sp.]MDA9005105.1 DUF6476 family protein [Amylibacter sp.]MDA9242875.1 DUF6476 family protein [Amylibacter sp.]MDA9290831.1 DUF6476 family protein [Amylibacter sp.]MDA9293294.1 DUF6476 family protein [Amylibacter sp.]|tara:strand:+ start:4289 stop:4594 length:306 start_codon:yes stop_codon:yes gene_type:complete